MPPTVSNRARKLLSVGHLGRPAHLAFCEIYPGGRNRLNHDLRREQKRSEKYGIKRTAFDVMTETLDKAGAAYPQYAGVYAPIKLEFLEHAARCDLGFLLANNDRPSLLRRVKLGDVQAKREFFGPINFFIAKDSRLSVIPIWILQSPLILLSAVLSFVAPAIELTNFLGIQIRHRRLGSYELHREQVRNSQAWRPVLQRALIYCAMASPAWLLYRSGWPMLVSGGALILCGLLALAVGETYKFGEAPHAR